MLSRRAWSSALWMLWGDMRRRRATSRPRVVKSNFQLKPPERHLTLWFWEPRIKTTRIDVIAGDDPSLVEIAISYVHLRTGRPDNLVYPFSLE